MMRGIRSVRAASITIALAIAVTPSLAAFGSSVDKAEAVTVAVPGVAPSGDLSDAVYVSMDGERLGTAAELGLGDPYADTQDLGTHASPAAFGCTPVSGRDDPHVTSGDASGHGWWKKGTCKNDRADVLNCLYEWYTDRSWRMKKCSAVETLKPYGGSSYRTNARIKCSTTHPTSWRNHVNVDVKWEVDTNEIPFNQEEINCRVP